MRLLEHPVRRFEHDAWQRAAAHYANGFGLATSLFVAPLLNAASVGAGMRVLDLCCGLGAAGAAAMARGAAVHGLDFSAPMLAEARALLPGLPLVRADAAHLPLRPAAYDAVVANFGIHHLPDPAAALAEARRVLVPGGRVSFSVWADPSVNIAWALVLGAVGRHGVVPASAPPPQGGFKRAEDCIAALAAAGFTGNAVREFRSCWHVADAASLLAVFRTGTARMAAVIAAQPPDILARITTDIAEAAAPFRTEGGLALPIAALIASGARPIAGLSTICCHAKSSAAPRPRIAAGRSRSS